MLVAFSVAPSGGDPSVGDAVAAAVRVVRDALGDTAYGTAYDEGTRLSPGEATALI
jgi:uncharacterized protein YqgV (UPF0045/DUF77 family)